jgi:WD40 repeat protein
VAFVGGGDRLLSMSFPESVLKLWDLDFNEELLMFDTGKYFVLFVDFSADGKRLFTHQRCWDTATGRLLARLEPREGWDGNAWLNSEDVLEWATNAPRDPSAVLLYQGAPVLRSSEALAFRPVVGPGKHVVALALLRGVIELRRASDGERLWDIPFDPNTITGLAFDHQGERLITWSNTGTWAIRDVGSGHERLTHAVPGSDQLVNAAFSWDDRLVATASYDGTARIYEAATGNELRVLRSTGAPAGDQSVVWSVAFSPDGTRLATGSKDRRIRLWDIATGQELFTLTRHAGTVMCLEWSPDGTQLASGGFDGTVCLWDSLSRAERAARGKLRDDPHAGLSEDALRR